MSDLDTAVQGGRLDRRQDRVPVRRRGDRARRSRRSPSSATSSSTTCARSAAGSRWRRRSSRRSRRAGAAVRRVTPSPALQELDRRGRQDRGDRRRAAGPVLAHDLDRAARARVHAVPARPEPHRPVRDPPADRRRHQAVLQGRADAGGRQPLGLPRGAGRGGHHRVPGGRGAALRAALHVAAARVPAGLAVAGVARGRESSSRSPTSTSGCSSSSRSPRSACTASCSRAGPPTTSTRLIGGLRSLGADVLVRARARPELRGRDHAGRLVPDQGHRRRAGRLVPALELRPAVPGLPRLLRRGHRRGEPDTLRPARGRDRAGGGLPHRVLVDEASRSSRWPSTST